MFELGLPDDGWDVRQHDRGGHLLQGLPWARFQTAIGRQAVWDEDQDWSWLGFRMEARGATYLFIPYGPSAASTQSLEAALTRARAAAIRLGLDFLRCEPAGRTREEVAGVGLKPAKAVHPEHTTVVDLAQPVAALHSSLRSGHRYSIRGAERQGVAFSLHRDSSMVDDLLRLLHLTAADRRFRTHPDSYYRTMLEVLMPLNAATLALARHQERVVGAAIALDYQDTRAYAHAAADPSARKLAVATPLVWRLMQDARAIGMTRFDLWGVAPSDAPSDHPWRGFSDFKRGFGGSELSYAGTWEMPIRAWKYRAYHAARRLAAHAR